MVTSYVSWQTAAADRLVDTEYTRADVARRRYRPWYGTPLSAKLS